jgi:dihydroorotate dehydrogenase
MNPFFSSTTRYLYAKILKPIFFQLNPEFVHNQGVLLGQVMGKMPFFQKSISSLWSYQSPRLRKTVDSITFPNPVGLSAGFDYNGDLSNILPAVGFGFHTIGTVTLKSYSGNQPPRLGRFPRSRALLVNKGLKNIGAKQIIKKLKSVMFTIPTGISIASTNKHFKSEQEQIQDITECFRLFENSSLNHAYYELNISCPNTFGGEPFSTPQRLKNLMSAMDKLSLTRPVYVKMPIDQAPEESLVLLRILAEHQVQGVIVGNLTKDKTNPTVHIEDTKIWQRKRGNLSGKPTWERSNELIRLTRKHFKKRFTIIGTGGIFSGEDAQHKLDLGADLVQLITGMIYEGPQLIGEINRYLAEKKTASVN